MEWLDFSIAPKVNQTFVRSLNKPLSFSIFICIETRYPKMDKTDRIRGKVTDDNVHMILNTLQ